MIDSLLATAWRRLIPATVLWIAFWPTLWFIRIGEITGPKAWFWIVGELSYPFAVMVFFLADGVLTRFNLRPLLMFCGSVAAVAVFMLFFYPRGGFSFGVLAEAFLF